MGMRQDFKNRGQERRPASAGKLAQAVQKGIDNQFIGWAEGFGRVIKEKVTTSQIRNIYGTVKRLEMETEVDLAKVLLLKPRIQYTRARNQGLDELADELCLAIDAIEKGETPAEKQQRFRRFAQGFEAILAYHRAADDK